jgi:hypothetical protein
MFEGPVTWAAASFLLGACVATACGTMVAVLYINNIRRDIEDKIVSALLQMSTLITREDFDELRREVFKRLETMIRDIGELKGRFRGPSSS